MKARDRWPGKVFISLSALKNVQPSEKLQEWPREPPVSPVHPLLRLTVLVPVGVVDAEHPATGLLTLHP